MRAKANQGSTPDSLLEWSCRLCAIVYRYLLPQLLALEFSVTGCIFRSSHWQKGAASRYRFILLGILKYYSLCSFCYLRAINLGITSIKQLGLEFRHD